MNRNVRYHPLFDSEVVEAAQWYDRYSSGLGDRFIKNLRVAVDLAIHNPERPARTPLGLLYYRVKKFPYNLIYDLTDQEILILGVLHTSRSAVKWLKTR